MKDIDIRNRLKETILKKYYLDGDTKVVDELGIFQGTNRVDLAVVNGHLHGYEIKSECDTLNRLPNQITSYSKVFDYITVVADLKHIDSVLENIPEYCGVYVAKQSRSRISFEIIRKPKKNIFVESIAIVQLLWKEEILSILSEMGIEKGLKNKNKQYLWSLLSQSLSTNQLSLLVRKTIKSRSNWKPVL